MADIVLVDAGPPGTISHPCTGGDIINQRDRPQIGPGDTLPVLTSLTSAAWLGRPAASPVTAGWLQRAPTTTNLDVAGRTAASSRLSHTSREERVGIMTTVPIQEAEGKLAELIHQLSPGDEVVITENGQPVARLVAAVARERKPRRLGSLKGTVLYMAPDFDAPLEDFKEYME
jgi:prevent-host-death family protein